jgi:hypothetical protein
MSKMRGVAPFAELWERRTAVKDSGGFVYEMLSLHDLVQAKKTQCDKDWPMLRRLLEADYAAQGNPSEEQVRFWLRELRTPELLVELARHWPDLCAALASQRLLLSLVAKGSTSELAGELEQEEREERERDRIYWQPLKAELEKLRHSR